MRTQDIPPHLHDRYGIRPPSRWRWPLTAVTAVLVLSVGGYAASRYVAAQDRPFALIQWASDDAASSVHVDFSVTRAAVTQWCAVRAQDFDHIDVGFAVVPVPAGRTAMTVDVAVLERPLAVDVLSCDADPYALPGPQFAPGTLPPAQQPPALAPGVHGRAELAALG